MSCLVVLRGGKRMKKGWSSICDHEQVKKDLYGALVKDILSSRRFPPEEGYLPVIFIR
ncbi:uncharacterized protein LY89DRAFT_692060 [Mollisia scopiformis]|uniref:Uncharacterized protein n=1 Tax=Mollisia scopiformis TaxID=149040 RepID=A0A132B5N7_MOLSC|nr:uncharacterized protein LY89DRAFT_692060 [Mollisia scopiformis]KUJ06977.1 hypothetical protein LY89DRAFT_692060 [Mollisia scopiformis]